MFQQTLKLFFLGKAALEMTAEKAEQFFAYLVEKPDTTSFSEDEQLRMIADTVREGIVKSTHEVAQRSEALEQQFVDKVRKQVAEFSMTALDETQEINELRAELASLRAELMQLRSANKVRV